MSDTETIADNGGTAETTEADAGQEGLQGEAAGLRRWIDVLDELEVTLATAAEASSEGEDPDANRRNAVVLWKAPEGLGPIPNELVERATKLAAAQQEAIQKLRAEMRQNRQEVALLDAVPTRGTSARSVYLDVNG